MSDQPTPRSPHAHTLPDGRQVALGRPRASVLDDPRTLRRFALRRFLPTVPPPAPKVDRPAGYTPRMFANDTLGDCTIAGEANFTLLSLAKAGKPAPNIGDPDVIARYSKVCGYKLGDPSTDQGGVELDVLNDWRADPFAGVELAAFAAIDVSDIDLIRYAVQQFGAVYVGGALPTTAQSQVGKLWDVVPGMVPGDWGGHCWIISAYDYTDPSARRLKGDTWGAEQLITEAFWRACGDECYAPLPSDYQNVPGLDFAALDAALATLGKVDPTSSGGGA